MVASTAAAQPEPERAPDKVSVVRPRPVPDPKEPVAPRTDKPDDELTADDVADAPLPGQESGRSDPGDGGDGALRWVGRGILFVPKLAVDAALAPVTLGVWATSRYNLPEVYRRVFYNDDLTIGLIPTISIDTSYGITAGARFIHKDLLGEREQLSLEASVGSRYRQVYSANVSTGDRLDERFAIEVDGRYERRPHDAFYGIGNGDEVAPPPAPIDPLADPSSVQASYRQDRARVAVIGDLKATRRIHVRAAGAASSVEFGPGDRNMPVDVAYAPSALVGWGGYDYGYSELELRWDNRHSVTPMEPESVYSTGSLAAVFAGRVHRLDGGPDFSRYGVNLQQFVRLASAPRVLAFHLHGEGVTGRRDEVPFTELPRLGGPTRLRGYPLDRFRDRVAAVGSATYSWDLSQWFSASLFVDAGRVYSSLRDLSVDDLRVGYGVALEAHSVNSFVLEGSIASSIDGGVFLNLSFNPVFNLDERVRRR